jgi:hypothetical protein
VSDVRTKDNIDGGGINGVGNCGGRGGNGDGNRGSTGGLVGSQTNGGGKPGASTPCTVLTTCKLPLLIISCKAPGQGTPPPPAVIPTQSILTSSSTSRNNSSTGSDYRSTSRGPPPVSPTSLFTGSVRYSTDPSSSTDTISLGGPPNGTFSTTSTNSGSNAGIIAGAVISALFVLFIIGFLLYRRRVRRRNRIAPSAQYLAENGSRPLSFGAFFNRRGSSQDFYDISPRRVSSISSVCLDHQDSGLMFAFSGKELILNLVTFMSVLSRTPQGLLIGSCL